MLWMLTHGLKFNPAKTQLIKFYYVCCKFTHTSQYKVLWLASWIFRCILVIFFRQISVTLKIYLTNAETCSISLFSHIYFNLFMDEHCGLFKIFPVSEGKLWQGRIREVPLASHTAAVHCTAGLHSLFNQVLLGFYKPLCPAEKCSNTVKGVLC